MQRFNILHHNSANPQTAFLTTIYFKSEKSDLMIHCFYSPDLGPNDFPFFRFYKSKWTNQ